MALRDTPRDCAAPHHILGADPGYFIVHWNGRSLRQVTPPNPVGSGVHNDLSGVTAASAGNARAVANSGDGVHPAVGRPPLAGGRRPAPGHQPVRRPVRYVAELSPAKLHYLTQIDHHDHEAIGAVDPADGRGVRVARFVRDAADPQNADLAVTVIEA